MSLSSLIRGKRAPAQFATATPATVATLKARMGGTVAEVATVTVAKPGAPEVASPMINVCALLAEACRDVSGLTAGQYRALLSVDDIEGILAGETGLEVLKAYAPLFAEGLRSGRLKVPEPIVPLLGECAHPAVGTVTPADNGAATSRPLKHRGPSHDQP